MKKSVLLKSIFDYANEMCEADGRKTINADYFLAATLNILLAESRGELDGIPGIVVGDTAALSAEADDVRAVFDRYDLDYMDVAVKLENAVKDDYDQLSGILFQKYERTADDEAYAAGVDTLYAVDFIKLLLKDPTRNIREFIIGDGEEKSQEQVATTAEAVQRSFEQFVVARQRATAFTERPDIPDDTDEMRRNEEARRRDDENCGRTPFEEIIAARKEAMEQRRKELLEVLEGMRSERAAGEAEKRQNPYVEPDGDDKAQPPKPQAMPAAPSGNRLIDVAKKAKELQNTLLSKVFGQDLAVEMFVSGYFQSELVSMGGAKRKKPRATFLFAGPPGVGKTFLAESAAEALGLPFLRVDMSGYAQHESNVEFCGSDRVYKSSHEGDVTGFVNKNPKCVVLFDEVEKAHIDVIHLFLQILDAGRLRDNYLQEEVDFTDAVLILTTNCGKKLYEDPDVVNLSSTPKKTVLRAIAGERKQNGDPFFPEPICSRFSAGNVVMFNRLEAHDLLRIVDSEIKNQTKTLNNVGELGITFDENISYAMLYSEGGNADARTVRGKTANFLYGELYEFYRLVSSEKNDGANVKNVHFAVEPPDDDAVKKLFSKPEYPEALVFASGESAARCAERCGSVKLHFASDVEQAKDVIADNDISAVVCDIRCGRRSGRDNVLNLEDIDSDGRDFFLYIANNTKLPLYILGTDNDITTEEMLSFSRNGAMGVVDIDDFDSKIYEKCAFAHQQRNMIALSGMRKILLYQTMQTIDGDSATVTLFDLKLAVAVDAEDGNSILSGVSRPTTRFDDVIGADNAKTELGFFIDWLKNPKKYARVGARPPKGILLYGPPGTGKTMLARALAGESEVTFIAAEGNRFLSKWRGEGVERVHELFATARKYAPSVLFIDEIDAVGISRDDSGSKNSSDILTALLTEMDGFKSHPDRPVFVLAATNRGVEGSGAELDPALFRRFDRRLLVDLPNREERETYIRLKSGSSGSAALSDAVISNIALRATGMSLADIESVIELAFRNATKTPDCVVTDELLEDAFETFTGGEIKKWSEATVVRTARHEAGHALMCRLSGERPSYLTVVARGDHGGYMQHGEAEDKQLYTKSELLGVVRTSLGGRAAEVVYYGDEDGLSTGASNDLQNATGIVMRMICNYGMDGRIGSINMKALYASPYYETVRNRADEILREQFEKTKAVIAECKVAIDALVDALLKKNKLSGDEIEQILSRYIED